LLFDVSKTALLRHVVIASRRESTARTTLKQLSREGDVQWHPVDVSDGKSVARLIKAVLRMHGHLDYAFNNGGSGGRLTPVRKMPEEAWRKTIDGYLTSVFLCMTAEIAAMKNSRSAVIINNASVDGLRGYPFPGGAAYSAAKHGVVGLTRSAALEHAASGPRICAVCPGWINTPPVANWMKRNKDVSDRHRVVRLVVLTKSRQRFSGFVPMPVHLLSALS
jgi:NAD(P)-dependent dehydrogenase (short-subunit alcohol dehydrogenase family)